MTERVMDSIRVAIAGAGNIATSRHLPTYAANERIDLVGIYDPNDGKSYKASTEYDAPAADSFEELCDSAELIVLCTPPDIHCEQAVTAMQRGCHVLTEKPMAMTAAETEEMIEVANETSQILSVVHNFLYMDSILEARELVDSGQLGTVTRTYMIKPESEQKRAKQYLERGEGGDEAWKLFRLFWDEAAHLMYLTEAFIGELSLRRAEVSSSVATTHGTIRAQFEGASGAEGNLSMLLDAPISEWWFVVIGTDGIALVDIYRDLIITFDREPDHSATRVLQVLLSGIFQAGLGSFTSGLSLIQDRYGGGNRIPDAGFSRQLVELLDAIESDDEPPVTGRQSARTIHAMEAVADATRMQRKQTTTANQSSS